MRHLRTWISTAVATTLIMTAGCGQPGPLPGGTAVDGKAQGAGRTSYGLLDFTESPDQTARRLAADRHKDWTAGIINCHRVEKMRAEVAPAIAALETTTVINSPGTSPENNPQLLDFFTKFPPEVCDKHDNGNGHGIGNDKPKVGHGYGLCKEPPGKQPYSLLAAPVNNGLTAPITGRPAIDGAGRTWFLTEDGDVYIYKTGDPGPVFSFHIKTPGIAGVDVADSFARSELTIAPLGAGTVGMVTSKTGNFFAINMTVGHPEYGVTGTMEFLAPTPNEAGLTPPVWFDNMRSTWTAIDAYACDNPGGVGTNVPRLHRFRVSAPSGVSTIHQFAPIGRPAVGSLTEFQQTAPIVWNGKLSIGTTRHHSSNTYTQHRAFFRQINLNSWLTGGPNPVVPAGASLPRPVTVPPALEIMWPSFQTAYVFQPAGNYMHFIDVTGASPITDLSLNALVLNPGDPPNGSLLDLTGEQVARVDPTPGNNGILGQPSIHWQSGGSGSYCVTVLNCNALWRIGMPVSTDLAAGGVDTSATANDERRGQFDLGENWTYQKTTLGLTSTVDGGGFYIANPCTQNTYWEGQRQWLGPITNPIGDEDRVLFMDNGGNPRNSTSVSAQVFNVKNGSGATAKPELGMGATGNPPSTGDLHLSPPPVGVDQATNLAGGFVSYNLTTATNPLGDQMEVIFHTSSNTDPGSTPSAALWRWVAPLP